MVDTMLSILSGGTNMRLNAEGQLKRKRDVPHVSEDERQDATCENLRKSLKIKVTGKLKKGSAEPITSFSQSFSDPILNNLTKYGYIHPTPVQMQAMPLIMQKHDLLACAPTGSGKTLSYVLPILARLRRHKDQGYRALVISPTRELATQICNQFRKMSERSSLKINLLTKSNAVIQLEKRTELANAYDVLITTPQRLINAITEDKIDLKQVRLLVLDEADRLFEDGFVEQTDEILAACSNKSINKALFSATLPSGVEQLAKTVMENPIRIIVGQKDTAAEMVDQELLFVGSESGKAMAMRQLATKGLLKPPVLIFVQSIDRAKELHLELLEERLNVDVIHSDRPQGQRDDVIRKFRMGEIWLLITTDVLSRGMDFQNISLVINYDFPQSLQSYIHRIGRTGRAGHRGKAITFFTKEDTSYLKSIASVVNSSGGTVPDWMMNLKAPSKQLKKSLKKKPLERKQISSQSRYEREKEAHKKDMIKASIIKKKSKGMNEQPLGDETTADLPGDDQ